MGFGFVESQFGTTVIPYSFKCETIAWTYCMGELTFEQGKHSQLIQVNANYRLLIRRNTEFGMAARPMRL